jgi:hypothetical protein
MSDILGLPDEVILSDIEVDRNRQIITFYVESEQEEPHYTFPTEEGSEARCFLITIDQAIQKMQNLQEKIKTSSEKTDKENARRDIEKYTGLDIKEGSIASIFLDTINEIYSGLNESIRNGGTSNDQGSKER